MDNPILETERLAFRAFTPDDLDLLTQLHSDPEVQRYIGGMWTAEQVQARLDLYVGQQAELGYSKWKAYLRDGTFIGRAGVSFDHQTGEPEVGYSFARAYWGRGYASEAARGVVEWMWVNTAVPELTAFAVVGNGPSRRVLEKLGMTYEGERDLHGDLCAYYRLKRPA